jgi:predicted PurR-regulated permease PerM
MKKGLNLHPFFILLSVLGGLEFFGPIGFITGPILLSVLATLLDIYTVFEEKAEKLDASATLAS